ncbi:MAG TPA: gamma-glutamyltransferase family protein [bacterium]|nr:gamma-glutamyltransferase family protein [bacterium]
MESGWQFRKALVTSHRGVVAAKHPLAARAGVEMLNRGGNAVDAAVATAFAIGVIEPWMSGLGGGGYMVVGRPAPPGAAHAESAASVVEFGMRSPLGAHAEMFELEDGYDTELFGWRRVRGQANIHGPRSIAIPGVPAGLALALKQLGTMPLAAVLGPAIALARDGFAVDWTTTLQVALDAATLRHYDAAASLFMPDGLPIVPSNTPAPRLLKQPDLARTLALLADEGPDAFYRGPVARRIVEDVRRAGGILDVEDFARYEARIAPALVSRAPGYEVALSSGPSGGATLAEIAGLIAASPLGRLGHNTAPYLHLLIEATHAAFEDRLRLLSDEGGWDALTSDAHLSARRAAIGERAAAPAGTGGASLARAASSGAPGGPAPDGTGADPTSTTHLCAADAAGTMVSLTQTLLSRFGSRVLVPGAGVLMNNGMMWFDPEPGHRNSAAPGRRPLANMTPAVVGVEGRPVLAVGASGGRRIINAVLQLVLNHMEFRMDAQAAIDAPRMDASGDEVIVDARIPAAVRDDLARRGHRVAAAEESMTPRFFASPVAVARDPSTGALTGGADPYHPAAAIGA